MTASHAVDAPPCREEMDNALHAAAARHGLKVTGHPVYGWRYRSVGAPAATRGGEPRWLRVGTEHTADLGPYWTGAADANAVLGVAKPRVVAVEEWPLPGRARWMRVDVSTWLPGTVCSGGEVLRDRLDLTDEWWDDLVRALAAIRATPTSRYDDCRPREGRVRAQFGDRAADAVRAATARATQHGDLHWANLMHQPFGLLDWEMWGVHPVGSDEATLYLRSLLVPAVTARIRDLWGDLLDSPAGRAAQLRAAAALLHRADEWPDLVGPLREHVTPLLARLP
jgi:hypothetical protein